MPVMELRFPFQFQVKNQPAPEYREVPGKVITATVKEILNRGSASANARVNVIPGSNVVEVRITSGGLAGAYAHGQATVTVVYAYWPTRKSDAPVSQPDPTGTLAPRELAAEDMTFELELPQDATTDVVTRTIPLTGDVTTCQLKDYEGPQNFHCRIDPVDPEHALCIGAFVGEPDQPGPQKARVVATLVRRR